MKSSPGPPAILGSTARAHLRLIVWCLDCQHQVEPDPAEMADRYGAEMSVPDWHSRLVCGRCGSRRVDMVVSGTERRSYQSPAVADRGPPVHLAANADAAARPISRGIQ